MSHSSESDDLSEVSIEESNSKRPKTKHDKRNDANAQRLVDATEVRNLIVGSESVTKQVMHKIINMRSELWKIGEGFSKYAHMRTKSDVVVCNLCISHESWQICEIILGKDKSTTALKSHFKSHHYPIYEAFVNSNVVKSEENIIASSSILAARPITNYFVPQLATQQIYKLCKLFVKKYFPLILIEGNRLANIYLQLYYIFNFRRTLARLCYLA